MKKCNQILTGILFLLYFITVSSQNTSFTNSQIDAVLTQWHDAAANANFDAYFKYLPSNAIYIGTDPTELWNKTEFMAYAKPYFDKGKAWNFKKVERNIYTSSESDTIAWFDELLSTQMGLCRGSGVMIRKNNSWFIQHYVLSIAVPNKNVKELTLVKKAFDSLYISKALTKD